MAATDTAVQRGPAPPGPPAPRRPPWTRLSAGHVVVVVAGLLAVVLNYSLLRAADDRVRVAVVARPIAAGDALGAGDLRSVEVAADDAVLGTLVPAEELDELAGHVAATALAAGDPLRRSDLRPPSAPDQRRAMSLPVPAEHAVAGQLQRGDRVDVIAVDQGTASYVLTDAEVLAVGGGDGGLTGTGMFSVTVAVDADSALRLAEAIRADAVDVVRSTGATQVPEPDGAPAADADAARAAAGDGAR